MRFTLILIIKIYWLVFPESKRRNCIYHKSCSKHVFDITKEKGLFFGLKALINRVKTCKPNHEIIYLEKEDTVIIKLANGAILQQNEISSIIVSLYKKRI